MKFLIFYFLAAVFVFFAEKSKAAIPDEHKGFYGISHGLAGGGSAFVSGLDALRLNPSLILQEKRYKILASYGVPANEGRKFYSLGFIDSFSSPLAAALSYSSFTRSYEKNNLDQTPIKDRIHLALAYSFKLISIGALAQKINYYEANTEKQLYLFNLGFLFPLNQSFRLAASVENLEKNEKVPSALGIYPIWRGGLAYVSQDEKLSLLFDYKQSKRKEVFTKHLIAGAHFKASESLVFMGGYSYGIVESEGDDSFSFGLSLLSELMEINYGVIVSSSATKHKTSHGISLSYALH